MTRLEMSQPAAVRDNQQVQAIIDSGVMPYLPACQAEGGDLMIWLLHFDLTARTLRTGIGWPPYDDFEPYRFFRGLLPGQRGALVDVQPLLLRDLKTSTAGDFQASGGDLLLPIFMDRQATHFSLLPLHGVTFIGLLSRDRDCIGSYEATDPGAGACMATDGRSVFRTGGTAMAFILLEEADDIDFYPFGQSLCAFLTGAEQGGRCPRARDGTLLVSGDWCARTDSAADSACHDAIRLVAGFAASGAYLRD